MPLCDVRPMPQDEINLAIRLIKKFADNGNIDVHADRYRSGEWSFSCNWDKFLSLNPTKITGCILSTQTIDQMDGKVTGGYIELYPDRSLIRFDGMIDWADDEHKKILHDIIKKHGAAGKNRLSFWFK